MQTRLFILCTLPLTSAAFSQNGKPNIVYLFPDQYRNAAMHFWEEEEFAPHVNFKADPVHTPNLDRFARESVVLASAQSNFPLSSPYRGMMLTGMYPDGNGVVLNCNSDRPVSNLREDVTTISDLFSQNGYDCAYIGKLHVDFPTPNNPQHPGTYVEGREPVWDAYTPPERRHGFNYWYSYGAYDVHKAPHYWDTNGDRHEIGEWSPRHEADKAIQFLKQERDPGKPFFLMVAMSPPHSPYSSLNDCMEEDYALYRDIPLQQLLVRPNINPQLIRKQQMAPYYFASVTGVDREFGRILTALSELGLDENTIVVFTSDHGETMASHVEDPKNSPYAESMNVPFLIRYPNKLQPHVSDLMLSTPDIMPTLLSLAGLGQQIPQSVQGSDRSQYLLQGPSATGSPESVLYLRNEDGERDCTGKVTGYFPISRGIKTRTHTLALTIDRKRNIQEILLFDDVNDPYQMHLLPVGENKELYRSLCVQLAKLLKDAADPWYINRVLADVIPYE